MRDQIGDAMGLTFGVLGPLWAEDDRGRLSLKGPRHRAVLARLLVARGRVVPVTQLVDDLWEQPPENAIGAIQTFIAALRRVLEPDRVPRQAAQVLVSAPPGYAVRIEPEQVDAGRFENAVRRAGELLDASRAAEAVTELDGALALWQGPAYAEFAEYSWARAEIIRLDEMRLLAVESRARALLESGRDADAVVAMESHLHDHPLREQAWMLFALALYRGGRQADALAALRTVRGRLRAELGVDPGPELRELEAAILAQAPHLDARRDVGVAGMAARERGAGLAEPQVDPGAVGLGSEESRVRREGGRSGGLFFGRARELARLAKAAEAASRGEVRLVLISGMEGAGKSALAEAFSESLAARGWATAWGPSPVDRGALPNWPWQRIVAGLASAGYAPHPGGVPGGKSAAGGITAARSLVSGIPPNDLARSDFELNGFGSGGVVGADSDDPAVGRFAVRRAAVEFLSSVARGGPVLVVFDDLHQAGEETLELLSALVTAHIEGPVLLVGVSRSTDVDAGLTAALARWARVEPVRIQLGGLSEGETGELVQAVSGGVVDGAAARRIHRRGNGNPFFTRELARLLRDEGEAAVREVPAGVRDVVRQRLTRLSETERTVLAQAAVVGVEIDRDLLTGLVGAEALALDGVDAGLRAGFLDESRSGGVAFAHGVVRDVLYREIGVARRAAWHGAVGELLEEAGASDPAVLAHHFVLADSRATAARAARYALAAGFEAEKVFAPHEAARWFGAAVAAYERDRDMRGRLEATMELGRAVAFTGDLAESRRQRAWALRHVEAYDDPALTARVLAAFSVPALWTDSDDPVLAEQVVRVAERTLRRLPDADAALRSRLLTTIALEVRAADSERGRAAAVAAEQIARGLDDPALVAFALNARFMQSFHRAGLAPERSRIANELIDLSSEHQLVTFEVLGHLIAVQSLSAAADFTAAGRHAAAADALGDKYGLPLVAVFTRWYSALRQSMSAPYPDAEAAYRAAAAAFPSSAMPGLERGLLPLALLCLHLRHDLPLDPDPATDWGPHEQWVRPLLLLEEGHRDEARRALQALPDPPPDLLLELRLCLMARAALTLDERSLFPHLHAHLLPAATELAGAGTGLLTLEPVAHYLARLTP